MLGSAIYEWAIGMVVEGTGDTAGTGAGGTGAVVAGVGGLEPKAPQFALL